MRLVQNSGSDRVIDLLLPYLVAGSRLGCVTPSFSLHAFAELRDALNGLDQVKLVLPADDSQLELLGSEGDRAQRNRLQARWLAKQCAQWLGQKVEVRRAHGRIPQGTAVVTGADDAPVQVVLGSFALSSEGLGLAPGNPLSLIQASETPEEASTLARWFERQWGVLRQQPEGAQGLIDALRGMAAHRAPFEIYALILHHLLSHRDEALDEDRIVKAATGIRNTVIWKKLFKFQRDGVVGAIDKLARFGGCIIADSVGLGKTFEALAIIKYHELRNDTVTDADEKYGLNWHGKRRARQLALTPSTGTLRPCPEESVDWDTTQNLMIEGDNLEVLKLLQKSYAGKVKLIYIDPPYNTGEDFVYPDSFHEGIEQYLRVTGQVEGGMPLSSNTETSGRFHTTWLNMIYPRIKLAWNLLRADGFLLVSIDDKEFAHQRTVLNELCGEENFIATLVFDRNRKNDAKFVSAGHEYMILYAKNKQLLKELDLRLRAPKEGVDEIRELFAELRALHGDNFAAIQESLKAHYASFVEDDPRLPLTRFTKVDERGPYRDDGDPSWPGGGGPRYDVLHPVTGKPCTVPSRGWVWPTYERMAQEVAAGLIVFGADEKRIPSVRRDLFEKDDQVLRSVIFSYAQKSSQDFAKLFDGKVVFQNPKSYRDLQRLVAYFTEPGDVVLDFFAGSGTTGHGTMLASADAQPPRRFVLVQLPEPLDSEDKDQKVAAEFCDEIGRPRTIAELTKERLRRAASQVRADAPHHSIDVGFRVFKLDASNIRAWAPKPTDLLQSLLSHQEHLLDGRTEQDLLYELLLKLGLDLCVPIQQQAIAGKTVRAVGAGVLLACLAESITSTEVEKLAEGIVQWHQQLAPAGDTTCVFLDSAFADDVVKTNMAAILQQHGIQNVRSL